MAAQPDRVAEKLSRFYAWHPLMANVAVKTHEFFQHEGLENAPLRINTMKDNAIIRVKYIDPTKIEQKDLYRQNEHTPAKLILYRTQGLVIYFPKLMVLQINHDPLFENNKSCPRDRVNLLWKSNHEDLQLVRGHDIISQAFSQEESLDIGYAHVYDEGQFNEKKLERFLYPFLNGPQKCLNTDNNNYRKLHVPI